MNLAPKTRLVWFFGDVFHMLCKLIARNKVTETSKHLLQILSNYNNIFLKINYIFFTRNYAA